MIVLNEADGNYDDDDKEDWSDEAKDATEGKKTKAPTMQDSRFIRLKEMGYIHSSASFAPKYVLLLLRAFKGFVLTHI